MDLETGRVCVGAELDRETRDLYVLNLTVKDGAVIEDDRRSTQMEVSTSEIKSLKLSGHLRKYSDDFGSLSEIFGSLWVSSEYFVSSSEAL